MLDIGLRVLEIPRPNDDQIPFSDPLPASHLSWNSSHTGLAVFAKNGDAASAEQLLGESEHFIDALVGHFDTDLTVACIFRILEPREFFGVHLFLKSATQPVSPNLPSGQPFLKSSPSKRRERLAMFTMRQPRRWQRIQRGR